MKLKSIFLSLTVAVLLVTASCSGPEGNNPGSEYVPDMVHSLAYEANYYDYYSLNTWGTEAEYYKIAKPRLPVAGTIARGYSGIRPSASALENAEMMQVLNGKDAPNSISVPANGSVPYYYADSDSARIVAINSIISNPFPITEDGLARGKELYNIYCGICHGEKGDGNGWLVDEANLNAKYPAQPRNFLDDEWTQKSNGAFYHAIMYGKGAMGGYSDKIGYEERWQVIHWIRALQAKDDKLVYSETENTLNTISVPGATLPKVVLASQEMDDHGDHDGHGHDGDDHHTDEHDNSGDHDSDHGHDGHGDSGH